MTTPVCVYYLFLCDVVSPSVSVLMVRETSKIEVRMSCPETPATAVLKHTVFCRCMVEAACTHLHCVAPILGETVVTAVCRCYYGSS